MKCKRHVTVIVQSMYRSRPFVTTRVLRCATRLYVRRNETKTKAAPMRLWRFTRTIVTGPRVSCGSYSYSVGEKQCRLVASLLSRKQNKKKIFFFSFVIFLFSTKYLRSYDTRVREKNKGRSELCPQARIQDPLGPRGTRRLIYVGPLDFQT